MKLKVILPCTAVVLAIWTHTIVVARPVDLLDQTAHLKSNLGHFNLDLSCKACEAGVALIRELLSWGVSKETIANRLLSMCKGLHIEDNIVCKGLIAGFQNEFMTVLRNTTLSNAETCVVMLGTVCSQYAYDPALEWSVKLPQTPKPPNSHNKPKKGAPQLKILQLADIHWDRQYIPGSNAACDKPICCQNSSGTPSGSDARAGYWGTLNKPCDIPEHTLDNLFSHIAKNEKIDMIYWTGDLPSHDIWKQSRDQQEELLMLLTNKLLKYFPNTPVFPVMGNHESFPVDSFPPPFITGNQSASWLYNTVAKTWSHWLPASTMDTIRYGAYYTVLVRPGFRIVSMNTNYCEHQNFWLVLNVTDPAHELQWLIGVLQAAEDNNEKVHLLGHIPPGVDDCLRVWSKNLVKIIVRYSETITGYYLAHTHFDHFQLIYDPSTHLPVTVGYIGPSVTTFTGAKGINPGYRVYSVDGFYDNSTWSVLDHSTTILNLTKANTDNITSWQMEYSAMAAYNLPDLSPATWHEFTSKLHNNDTLFNLFYNHYYKMNAPGDCDKTCKDTLICSLRTSTSGDNFYCEKAYTSKEKMEAYRKLQPNSC